MGINEQKRDIKEIWRRVWNRDFSGEAGLAVKNNIFQTSKNLVNKFGSLIFTIIIARLLMPELFGLYSLALSTIILFSVISDPGICESLIRFVSRELGRKNIRKAKAYAVYFGKIKFLLVFVSILVLIFTAKFISDTYYQKPLFLALIAGAFYLVFLRITSFMQGITQSSNYFEGDFYKEIVLQVSRLALVPFAVLMALKYGLSSAKMIFLIIIALSIAQFFSSLLIVLLVKKRLFFFKTKASKISSKEKKKANKFLIAVSAAAFSGLFFGNIDMLMLGHFVDSEFIGYYRAGLVLISALMPLISFTGPLLPIFSRIINEKKLRNVLDRSIKLVLLMSVSLFLVVFIFAHYIILIIYGGDYLTSVNILRAFSLLLFTSPIIVLYRTYFLSIEKPQVIIKILLASTFLNILLNYLLIIYLLKYSQLHAVFGVVIATLLSSYFLLFGLILKKRKLSKILESSDNG